MAHSLFTPKYIQLRERRQRIALFLVIVATPLILFNLTLGVYASETTTYDLSSNPVTLPLTASTSDATFDDFSAGNNLSDPFAMTAFLPDGGVEINQGYAYTTETSPGLENVGWSPNDTNYSYVNNNLLYIGTYGGGLPVINTQGTTDPSDDTLVTRYHTGSTPALANNVIRQVFLENNLLYIGTDGGLSVIDTKGTTDPGDDTLVTRYHTGSTPALADDDVYHTFLNNNLLYVSTYGGGLSVIDTKGTTDPGDDTLVTRYHTGSAPALANDRVIYSSLNNNLLYVSTWGGLSVINTQGTVSAADDTLVTRYHTGSAPALANNSVFHSFLSNNLLYVSTYGGLSVINTQGTTDPVDDTFVTRYHTGSTPALASNSARNSFLSGTFLYVSTEGGLSVIDTKGTTDPVDDTFVTRYHTGSTPGLLSSYIYYATIYDEKLYISSWFNNGGLSIINTSGTYQPVGSYLSNPRPIATTPTTTLSVDATVSSGQNVSLSYRSGSADAVWFDDFADADSYVGDVYAWGAEFQNVSTSSVGLRFSDPNAAWGGYIWFDTGKPADYFQPGSVITARVRVNSTVPDRQFGNYLFLDEWERSSAYYETTDDNWITVTYIADTAFSRVGFEPYFPDYLGWNPGDYWEIDWLKITTPDSMGEWGPWTTCASYSTCVLSDLGSAAWLQYKLDLETDDTSTSPTVTKVTYQGDYAPTSTYTSDTTTFLTPQNLGTFTPTATTPTGTAISYEYSTDGGTTWTPITPGADIDRTATSFTWRAHLSTTDGAYTPTITSVSLTHTAPSSRTSTSLKTRIERLEATNPDAAAALKAKYPHLFDGTARPEDIQAEIIWRLEKVIELYLRLLEEKEE